MTSSSTYSFAFDAGTSMSFALSATLHVLSEVYLTIVSIIIFLRMVTFGTFPIISKIEKHRMTQCITGCIVYLTTLGGFLVINAPPSTLISYGAIRWAGYVNIVTHYFQSLLWIQYACLPEDDVFVIEIQKPLGAAVNYLLILVFGIHTLGTSLHPLVDSQLSMTGHHDCNDEKTDMIILHGTLSIIESFVMACFWISLNRNYCGKYELRDIPKIGDGQIQE
jgi:hypothetical protein